ncbi:hypothetical protein [Chryseobacterium aquaticum]|uniref:hypothetical protein n=1 Tax=Chryseobacterium aquaticum TaxID=452084 RepID=UPI003F6E5A3F
MKRKLFLRLCLILMVGLSAFSCRTDQFPEAQSFNDSSKFQLTSKRISLDESKHKAILLPELKKAEAEFKAFSKTNAQGKVVNYGNGISIDTDDVIYIEKGSDFHSYTFHIKHENALADAPVENLVLTVQEDGTYSELLLSYNFTQQEKQNLMIGIPVNAKGKVTITELAQGTYNNGGLMGKQVCVFVEKTMWNPCSSGAHNGTNANQCEFINNMQNGTPPTAYVVVTRQCTAQPVDYGLGENGENGGSGPQNGPGGLSGNNPEETTTAPNVPSGATDEICSSLATKSLDLRFQEKISGLKTTDANGPAEAGYAMYNDDPRYGIKSFGSIDGNGEAFLDLKFDPNRIPSLTGFMHCHLNHPIYKNLAVFSIQDFIAMGEIVQVSIIPINELALYVTSDKGTFAIKIADKQAFLDFVSYLKNNGREVNERYDRNIKWTMTKNKQIRGLLNLLQEKAGTGIELYESDSTFKNWKKHYLDSDNNLKNDKCL